MGLSSATSTRNCLAVTIDDDDDALFSICRIGVPPRRCVGCMALLPTLMLVRLLLSIIGDDDADDGVGDDELDPTLPRPLPNALVVLANVRIILPVAGSPLPILIGDDDALPHGLAMGDGLPLLSTASNDWDRGDEMLRVVGTTSPRAAAAIAAVLFAAATIAAAASSLRPRGDILPLLLPPSVFALGATLVVILE